MGIFTFYPIINTFFISFLKNYNYMSGANDGFTFDNYGIVLGLTETYAGTGVYNLNFIQYALPNTLIITFVTVPISVILALFIAIGVNSIKVCQKFFQTVFFIPYVTNIIAVGMVFAVIFADGGVFNTIFNLSTKWVSVGSGRLNSMVILCLYIIWSAMPYKILIFLSGLQGVDKQYYEAAKIDSASKWKRVTKITFPLISPQILYITVTSFIGAFKEYNAVIGLFNRSNSTANGNVNDLYTVVYYIYDQFQGNNPNMARAAAAAVILFAIIMIFTAVEMRISKKRVHY